MRSDKNVTVLRRAIREVDFNALVSTGTILDNLVM